MRLSVWVRVSEDALFLGERLCLCLQNFVGCVFIKFFSAKLESIKLEFYSNFN